MSAMLRRAAPALVLFLIAPFVAEFLLGNISAQMLAAFVSLAPMYGGGAVLIRETARRSGRGWPTMLCLALAYGVCEEAFMMQSLFNPDFMGAHSHLLDPAWIPWLGMGGWWTIYVLGLHVFWSIAAPIALVESLFPERAQEPWLKLPGLLIDALLFLFIAVASTFAMIRQDPVHFMASPRQWIGAALAVLLLTTAAFAAPRTTPKSIQRAAPPAWLCAAASFAFGVLWFLVRPAWQWMAAAALMALLLAGLGFASVASRMRRWGQTQVLGLCAGALAAYAVRSFVEKPTVGAVCRTGNVVFALTAALLVWLASRRLSKEAAASVA